MQNSPAKRGSDRISPPLGGGATEEEKEQGRRPQVCIHFLSGRSNTFPPQPPFFPQFSAVSPATGRIRQTGLCSGAFFSPEAPEPRGIAGKRGSGWQQKRFGKEIFPHPAPDGSPRPEPRSLPRHFDRSPGPRPGRRGEIRRALPPGKQWRRHRAVPGAGLRRRPGFSPSTSLRAGCFASVEMTGGVLRSGRSGRKGAGRGGHTSGVGKSSYRERNWQCQGLLSKKRKYF